MKQILLVSLCLWGSVSFSQENSKNKSLEQSKEANVNKESSKKTKSSVESKKGGKIYLPLKRNKLTTVRELRVKTKTTKL